MNGWEFDDTSRQWKSSSGDVFECPDCGDMIESGFTQCSCGKSWNSYMTVVNDRFVRSVVEVPDRKRLVAKRLAEGVDSIPDFNFDDVPRSKNSGWWPQSFTVGDRVEVNRIQYEGEGVIRDISTSNRIGTPLYPAYLIEFDDSTWDWVLGGSLTKV